MIEAVFPCSNAAIQWFITFWCPSHYLLQLKAKHWRAATAEDKANIYHLKGRIQEVPPLNSADTKKPWGATFMTVAGPVNVSIHHRHEISHKTAPLAHWAPDFLIFLLDNWVRLYFIAIENLAHLWIPEHTSNPSLKCLANFRSSSGAMWRAESIQLWQAPWIMTARQFSTSTASNQTLGLMVSITSVDQGLTIHPIEACD